MVSASSRESLAELAETVGNALLVFAGHLRDDPETTAAPGPELATESGEVKGPRVDRSRLGAQQLRVLEVLKEAGSAGLVAAEVADKTRIRATNVHRTLAQLAKRGLAASSEDSPKVWRISPDGLLP